MQFSDPCYICNLCTLYLYHPPVHVPRMKEDCIKVSQGGDQGPVVSHIAISYWTAPIMKGVIAKPKPEQMNKYCDLIIS